MEHEYADPTPAPDGKPAQQDGRASERHAGCSPEASGAANLRHAITPGACPPDIALRLAEALDRENAQYRHSMTRVLIKLAELAGLCDILAHENHELRRDPRVARSQRERAHVVVDTVLGMVLDILDEHGIERMAVVPGQRVELARHRVIDEMPAGVVAAGCVAHVHQLGFVSRSTGVVLSKSLVRAAVGRQK